ncbi:anti-sigma factor family protein [Bacteroidota bacterium]
MNCKKCIENLNLYLQGDMPEDMKSGMKTHLDECEECKATYVSIQVTEKLIMEESAVQSNPFLATRIMATIESQEENILVSKKVPAFNRILQPVFVTVLILAAMLIGVLAGNLVNTAQTKKSIPEELVYLNVENIESLSVFMNE